MSNNTLQAFDRNEYFLYSECLGDLPDLQHQDGCESSALHSVILPSIKPNQAYKKIDNISITVPSTRFYGSKRRLLDWMYPIFDSLNFQSALDVFGGSSSVSIMLKRMGKDITFNDAMKFNTICATALLSNEFPFDTVDQCDNFIKNIKPLHGFISKNFENIFYTSNENSWLDGAIQEISKINCVSKEAFYLDALFQACLMKRPYNLFHRANLNLRLATDVKRSFGNKVTWETSFQELMLRRIRETKKHIFYSPSEVSILPAGDALDVTGAYDLVYIDPPYVPVNGGYGDDYLKRYHFLEGLSRYSEWSSFIDYNTKIKAFNPLDNISNWHEKSRSKEALYELIDKHKQSIVVLSYVSDGYPSESELVSFFKDKFSSVIVYRKTINYALAKKSRDEILIIGENK